MSRSRDGGRGGGGGGYDRDDSRPRNGDGGGRGGAARGRGGGADQDDSPPPLKRSAPAEGVKSRRVEAARANSASRSPPPTRPATKDAQVAVDEVEEALQKAKEDEIAARKALKKLKAAVDRETTESVQAEQDKLTDEIVGVKEKIQKALRHTLSETEQRIEDELSQRTRDLKDDFADKLKEEKQRAEEDCERMIADEILEMKEKHNKKIKDMQEDAENDKELVEERDAAAAAEESVKDMERKLGRAKARLEGLKSHPQRD